MGKTYNFMKDILDGKIAVKKEHPEPGEYEYYYYDPTYPQDAFTPLTKIPTVPVPTADTPNPALQPGYRSRNYTPAPTANDNPYESQKPDSAFSQITGAIGDLYQNYMDMRKDKVIGNDDYFHCKGNFDATRRGAYGELTAELLGDAKERFDYIKNRFKGLNAVDSYADYLHDKHINYLGRHQAKTGLYSNSKDACNFKRKEHTDEKY